MSLLKKVYYEACSMLPMTLVSRRPDMQVLLPYHHTVSSEFLPHISHLYNYKNERQFTDDLDFILKHYNPISQRDLLHKLTNGLPVKNSFLLTFDDGFREVYDNIAPILERKGVPAVFFINPAFIDNNQLFYRCKISLLINELKKAETQKDFAGIFSNILGLNGAPVADIIRDLKLVTQNTAVKLDIIADKIGYSFEKFLAEQKPFLTTAQLQSLVARGFEFGAHSIDHPYYKLLSIDEQLRQTTESCNAVNQMAGTENCSFSFPHSDKELSQQLFDSLLQTDIPGFYGIQNQKQEWNNRMLHRFNAERPATTLQQQVKGLAVLSTVRQMRGTNKLIRI